ncbi:hypothetical protein BJ6T_31680 [Bradyrhizobium japonicum USDA 6]|nr:hypothetical protein BJ6T_31680 [Bradyrhizobium japonicum USDA 6]
MVLGRVERRKQLLAIDIADAASAVAHQQFDGTVWSVPGTDPDAPLADGRRDHRIHGIDDEIEKDLLKLHGVAVYYRPTRCQVRFYCHAPADQFGAEQRLMCASTS